MANEVLTDAFTTIKSSLSSGPHISASSMGTFTLIGLFVGLAVISVVFAFLYFFWYEKKKWNIMTRVHYENPAINGISIGNPIPTKRVRFKDGRVVYLYKYPIQGYTISPELLVWTRPREHDVIVTQDKKLFCLLGINNIDEKRKKLNVDISHPDIEMDRQDLQHYIDSKKYDDPNERLKIIAKAATWIFVAITVITLAVLAGNAYEKGKNIDLQRDSMNLKVTEMQSQIMEDLTTFTAILDELMPELQKLKGTKTIVYRNSTTGGGR